MNYTIYLITNTTNNKFYVGSTNDAIARRNVHWRRLRMGVHHSAHLQAAWNTYGEDAFTFTVVETYATKQEMLAAEQRWLDKHVGTSECYNFAKEATSPWLGQPSELHPMYGKPRPEETRGKLSQTLKQVYADGVSHPRLGKKHTEETKKKISESMKGQMKGEKHYRWGKTLSEEVRKKIGDTQRGVKKAPRTMTEEGREKIRAAAAAGHYSNFSGKRHTDEAKEKISKTVIAINDLGEETKYSSITKLREVTGLKAPTINRALKSGKPIAKGKYVGWSFRYGNPDA